MEPLFKPHPAVKISLGKILNGNFNSGDEQIGSYLEAAGEKIYRLNVMAIIVNQEKTGSITNLVLDDGTGMISLRFFEESSKINELKIGEALMVIGKLRVYNQEKYLSPEIVKKISPLWLKVRKKELKGERWAEKARNNEAESHILAEEEIEEKAMEIKEEAELLPSQKMMQLIKKLDQGSGVAIEEVMEKSYLDDTELILEQMLKKGDIFQNSPGKVKVL